MASEQGNGDAEIARCMGACPDFVDFPTAWAIQRHADLTHDPRCSSVPGWHPLSGPGLLCDCGAIATEWRRRKALTAGATNGQ